MRCSIWFVCFVFIVLFIGIASPQIRDISPPVIGLEYPLRITCLYPDSGRIIVDCWDPDTFASGVDSSSITVTVTIDGDSAEDVTSECAIVSFFGLYRITWEYEDLPYSERLLFCVDASDLAGNAARTFCKDWTICDEDTVEPDTVDICPPVVGLEYPLRITCLYPDSGRIIVDCWDPDTFASGVDSSSITVTVTIDGDSAEDVTSECAIVSSFGMYRITWEYEDLPYDESLLLCVDASDLAGNAARTFCEDWTTCGEDTVEPDTVDVCPPDIGLEYPWRITCLYPDSGRVIVDCWDDTSRCVASGVDSSSITVTVTIDGDSAEDVTSECAIVSSFSSYRITWEYEDLPYSERLLFCVDASDLAGNAARTFCEDWTICSEDTVEPDTVDICPPAIGLEYPLRITCLYPDSGRIIVDCWDIDTGWCIASGVDSSSITVMVTIDGDSAEDVTSECAIVSSFGMYRITWEYEDLPYSERLLFCVDASDLAGNAARTFCKDWTTCDPDTVEPDTVDICPPVIGLEYPLRVTCLYPDSGRIIVDCWDPDTFASGVDSSSITVTVTIDGDSAEDVTSECAIVSSFGGYRITWEYEDLPPTERLLFCVDASDLAGNVARTFCEDWTTCGEPDTVDICPPVIRLEYPLRITCLYPDSGRIIVDCWDDTGWCIASGVDSSSITVMVTIDGDSAEDVTSECAIVSSFGMYRITWEYEDLPYSERLLFCVDASDLAGNAARTFCEGWTTCDPDTVEPDTVDICPPVIGLEYPLRITCLYPDSGRIIVDCWDIDTGRCFASGVDSSSITVMVTIDGDSAEDVTSECAISSFFGLYKITWEYEDLPYGESLLLCVNASDLAGNAARTFCKDWTICDEPDTVDFCPPVIGLEYPLRITSLYPDSGRIIVDCLDLDTGRCAIASGVDSSSITVTVTIDGYTPKDVTSECAIVSHLSGYRITWEYEDLPYDKSLQFSVHASDLANNIADTFYTFSGEWIYDTSLLILRHPTINVYPNPFNQKCDILIHSPIEPLTGVCIYDIFGKQIEKFNYEGLKTHSYRLEWDGSAHPSGIYMIRATAGSYDQVMRILLIK